MTSRDRGRQDRRPQARPLTPRERAGLYRAALQYRAELRAQAAADGEKALAAAQPQTDDAADRRARYAAAIARAEFGRFYWKGEARKLKRTKRPRPNGARTA